jgi:hypothetical protein
MFADIKNIRIFVRSIRHKIKKNVMKREKQIQELWDLRGYEFKYLNTLSDKELNCLWDTEFYYDWEDEIFNK